MRDSTGSVRRVSQRRRSWGLDGLKEELGFDTDLSPAEKFFVKTGNQSIFNYRFLGVIEILEPVLNLEEVETVRFFSKAEFNQLISQGEKVSTRSEDFVQSFFAREF